MCIIAVKKSGIDLPPIETLKNCFSNNSDGAGLMYHKDKRVYIEKGFMTWTDFENRLERLKTEIDTKKEGIIFHFRIGTAGTNSKENCHPYTISNDYNVLHETNLTTDIGVAHNGILSEYNPTKDEEKNLNINDTQKFIANVLDYFKSKNGIDFVFNKKIRYMLSILLNGNKLAFLDRNNRTTIFGEFVEDTDGMLYSNETFMYNYSSYYYDKWYDKYNKYYDYFDKDFEKDYTNTKDSKKETKSIFDGVLDEDDYYSSKEYVLNNLEYWLNKNEIEEYKKIYNEDITLQNKYENVDDYIYDSLMGVI